MKKLSIFAIGIILSVASANAQSTNDDNSKKQLPVNNGKNYVDANKDGVCDNHKNNHSKNFIDLNKDGICDNYDKNKCCNHNKEGYQHRHRYGKNAK